MARIFPGWKPRPHGLVGIEQVCPFTEEDFERAKVVFDRMKADPKRRALLDRMVSGTWPEPRKPAPEKPAKPAR